MKIPAVASYRDWGGHPPLVVMAPYRTMQGVKKPAMGTNQCRSNNGYKGGVLSPAFWKVKLNSVPSFYSDIESLCESIVHEIEHDSDASPLPRWNAAWPIHEPLIPAVPGPFGGTPEYPPKWVNTFDPYGMQTRAIYTNYTPYTPPPNRTPVPEQIGTGRNPDYVTSVDCGSVLTLAAINTGSNNMGDIIEFSGGTALWTLEGLYILTNTGFEPGQTYTQTGSSSGTGSGMTARATKSCWVSSVELLDLYSNPTSHYEWVCGELHTVGDILTFTGGGTARVTEIRALNETTGILVSLAIVNEAGFITAGNQAEVAQVEPNGSTGNGTDGKVLVSFTGLLRYDIVDGGSGFVEGDRTFFYTDTTTTVIDVSEVDANGTIRAFTLIYNGGGGLPLGETHGMDYTYSENGAGFQIYAHPTVAISPVPTIEVLVSITYANSCGAEYQLGDIVEFGDARGVVTALYSHPGRGPWLAYLGDPYGWMYYGTIAGIAMTDYTGLEPDGVYTATGVIGGNEQASYPVSSGYPGPNWPGSGAGHDAAIKAISECTIDRIGWPKYTVGIRSMKSDDYGYASVAPGNLQIAVGLLIPRFSDRYRIAGSWYPEPQIYIAWGIEVTHEMYPNVMRMDSLTLPCVGVAHYWYGQYYSYAKNLDGFGDWSNTTITLTRTNKPTDNYPGRPYASYPFPPWIRK